MIRSKRFFYLLIFLAIVAALFYSTLAGLIILIGAIIYYFVLGRQARIESASQIPPSEVREPRAQKETVIEREVLKVPCKYCNTLIDPIRDKTCPQCGAPVQL